MCVCLSVCVCLCVCVCALDFLGRLFLFLLLFCFCFVSYVFVWFSCVVWGFVLFFLVFVGFFFFFGGGGGLGGLFCFDVVGFGFFFLFVCLFVVVFLTTFVKGIVHFFDFHRLSPSTPDKVDREAGPETGMNVSCVATMEGRRYGSSSAIETVLFFLGRL